MKKLLLKLCVLAFLVGTIQLGLFFLFPRPVQDLTYEAAILDKHQLLKGIKPPRIIFMGGSNLAFGLDSVLVQKQLGMPVVNMGLHAGLGLRYMLSEVRPFIGKGDVLVVMPEYEQFFDTTMEGGFDLAFVAMRFPECRRYLTSWKQYLAIIINSPYAFRTSLYNALSHQRFSTSAAYCRSGFNGNGDSMGHLKIENTSGVMKRGGIEGKINHEAIDVLNDLEVYARTRGARVFFIYPALEEGQSKEGKSSIDRLDVVLRQELKMPILGAPSDDVFPENCFYDSVYHLNASARTLRAQRVIAHLRGIL